MWMVYDPVIHFRFYSECYFCYPYSFLDITPKLLSILYNLVLLGDITYFMGCCGF